MTKTFVKVSSRKEINDIPVNDLFLAKGGAVLRPAKKNESFKSLVTEVAPEVLVSKCSDGYFNTLDISSVFYRSSNEAWVGAAQKLGLVVVA